MSRTRDDILRVFPVMESRMRTRDKNATLEMYQVAAVKAVFNTDHAETLTLRDCGNHLRELAKERNLEANDTIQTALKDMEFIGREIAAARSGASGERAVEKSIRYSKRRVIPLHNVILSAGEDRTELDQVVVTSNGIWILEVKNYKSDVTIAETGQVYETNRKWSSDKSLGDQMNLKRYLLRSKIEQELGEHDIPVYIDSRVVFSNPSILVTDRYHQEKYCFTATLPHEIDQFTSEIEYSLDEMKIIAAVIESISEEENLYDIGMDFNRIRETFAEALVLLESDGGEEEKDECAELNCAEPATHDASERSGAERSVQKEDSQHSRGALVGCGVVGLAIGAGLTYLLMQRGK